MPGRRGTDWVQFCILMVTFLAAYWAIANDQGKILAELDDLRQNVSHLEQRLDELQSRKEWNKQSPSLIP